MDPESIMAADGADSALANGGGLTMESVCIKENGVASDETLDTTSESQNENSGNISTLDAIEHLKEAAEVCNSEWSIYSARHINTCDQHFCFLFSFGRAHKLKM